MDALRGIIEKPEPIALAQAQPFAIGTTRIFPSRLIVAGPQGEVSVEPRVMQVLIALHDAENDTVSRADLLERCWPGVTVGDDSLNRAIAELRRALREAGTDWTVETVPRVGYRIDNPAPPAAVQRTRRATLADRRGLIVGGAAVAALAAGAAVWRGSGRFGDAPEVEALVGEARQALREQLPARNRVALKSLLAAQRQAPDNPEVLGLLAVAWRDAAEFEVGDKSSEAARSCEAVAKRALAIDPGNGNALSALATLQPFYGDWMGAEKRCLDVLRKAPDALPAITHLTSLYQSSGYLAESKAWNDKALRLDPLSPVFQFRAALKLWFVDDLAAADAQIDRALDLWPKHPAVWNTRLMLYAFTARAEAGRQFLRNAAALPDTVPRPTVALWDAVLSSLSGGGTTARDLARSLAIEAAFGGVSGAHTALMYLSYADELDAAFEVANGFFLRRGRLAASGQAKPKVSWVTDQSWRRSMMLFTPAMASFRADPRFPAIAEGMGLTAYWKARGKQPDYPRF